MKDTILGSICLALAASIWGGMYVFSKYVLEYISPITLVWLRYVIAFTVLFIILKITTYKKKSKICLDKKDWGLLAFIGFIGYFLSIYLQFLGTKLSDAHTGSLITSAVPAFIVLFARIILKEKITVQKLISLIIATFGVLIVIGWHKEIGAYFWGCIVLLGAAITWALLSVYVKVLSKKLNSLTITTYSILFSLLYTTPFMLFEIKDSSIVFNNYLVILGVVYIGIVSTAGAFFLWNKGMELMDAGIGSLFFFFQPIVGATLGCVLLNEKLNINFYFGGVLILIGIGIVTLKQKHFEFIRFFIRNKA